MEKWRSIAAGMSCLSMLFATGAVTVSASDEITEIPEQSIVYWSMWEEDEPQADVIREAAEAYEEATYFCRDSVEGQRNPVSDRTCPGCRRTDCHFLMMIIRGWLRNTGLSGRIKRNADTVL